MIPSFLRPFAILRKATPDVIAPVAGREPVRLVPGSYRMAFPLRGWLPLLGGLVFLAAGIAPGWSIVPDVVDVLRAGLPPAELWADLREPLPAFIAVVLFFSVGVALVVSGAADLTRARRRAARARRYPDAPWRADHDWEREAGLDETGRGLGGAVLFVIVAALIGAPFLLVDAMRWMLFLPALVVTVGLGGLGYELARRWRWGRSRVRFLRIPVHPGETLEVALEGVGARVHRTPLVATLRCVQERYEETERTPFFPNRRTIEVAHWELWSTQVAVPAGAPVIAIPVPADVPGAELDVRPARYWELELRAEVPGPDYQARFLVPIYSRGQRR